MRSWQSWWHSGAEPQETVPGAEEASERLYWVVPGRRRAPARARAELMVVRNIESTGRDRTDRMMARRKEGLFEVKALHLEPGVIVDDALVAEIKSACGA